MRIRKNLPLVAGVLLLMAGCGTAPGPVAEGTTMQIDGNTYSVTGPYAHENLSVFLIHTQSPQDDRDFITLDEGLKEGIVKVTEKEQAQVGELVIDNQSERPLFLQEGDRLQGGKQDRTVITSIVVPGKSGKTPVPTFCIEQSRWVAGSRGGRFDGTENTALAPKEVRQAAKVSKSQPDVWNEVGKAKGQAMEKLAAPNTNSSLNEALDSPQVKKISDACTAALGKSIEGRADAVGVAVAVNGKIEEVNLYPNNRLLSKLYPRLLQSYSMQAALEKDKVKDTKPLGCSDVTKFMATGEEKDKREEQVDKFNRLKVAHWEGQRAACVTEFDGKPVHRQVLGNAPAAGERVGGQAPAQIQERGQNRQPMPNQPPVQQQEQRHQPVSPPTPMPPPRP